MSTCNALCIASDSSNSNCDEWEWQGQGYRHLRRLCGLKILGLIKGQILYGFITVVYIFSWHRIIYVN